MLVIITEDDRQEGVDYIGTHRSVLIMTELYTG